MRLSKQPTNWLGQQQKEEFWNKDSLSRMRIRGSLKSPANGGSAAGRPLRWWRKPHHHGLQSWVQAASMSPSGQMQQVWNWSPRWGGPGTQHP